MFGRLCCCGKSCLMYIAVKYIRMCVRMYSVNTYVVYSCVPNVRMCTHHSACPITQ